jgi:hypothetical protein
MNRHCPRKDNPKIMRNKDCKWKTVCGARNGETDRRMDFERQFQMNCSY